MGEKSDPIEIDSTEDLPLVLYFKTGGLYVTLKNVRHYAIKLKECRNFTIEGCSICKLELQECWHVAIRNNSLGGLKLHYCNASNFESNQMPSGSLTGLRDYLPQGNLVLFLVALLGIGVFLCGLLIYGLSFLILSRPSFTVGGSWVDILYAITFTSLIGLVALLTFYIVRRQLITLRRLNRLDLNRLTNNSTIKGATYLEELCNHCFFDYRCPRAYSFKAQLSQMGGAGERGGVSETGQQAVRGAESRGSTVTSRKSSIKFHKTDIIMAVLLICATCLAVPLFLWYGLRLIDSDVGLGSLYIGLGIVVLVALICNIAFILRRYRRSRGERRGG